VRAHAILAAVNARDGPLDLRACALGYGFKRTCGFGAFAEPPRERA